MALEQVFVSHVLIMDDEPEFAFELRNWLEGRGYDVTWSRSASEALEVVENDDIDVIITDIYVYNDGMPIPDGGVKLIGEMKIRTVREVCRKADRVPVIAISAAVNMAGNELVLHTAQRLGADFALAKPLNYEDLAKCLKHILALVKT